MATTTLKLLRELNNYTQEYIAEEILHISQHTYSMIERNPKKLKAEQASRLAELYNVSIADLLSETTPMVIFKEAKFDTGNNAYVNHVEHDNRQSADHALLESLRKEVEFLRQQNLELLKILGEKMAKN